MIKMARKYGIEKYGPNRYHIVTAKMGFHGRTFGAMSATGQPGNGCPYDLSTCFFEHLHFLQKDRY